MADTEQLGLDLTPAGEQAVVFVCSRGRGGGCRRFVLDLPDPADRDRHREWVDEQRKVAQEYQRR